MAVGVVACTMLIAACGDQSSGKPFPTTVRVSTTVGNADGSEAPEILSFVATQTDVQAGDRVELTWEVDDPGANLLIDGGVGPVFGSKKSVVVDETTTFTLYASNVNGTESASVTINVAGSTGSTGPAATGDSTVPVETEVGDEWVSAVDNLLGLPSVCGNLSVVSAAADTLIRVGGQVVHIDLTRDWPAATVRNALNAHLAPAPISVLEASVAPDGWHARFSATERRYRYRILNRMSPPALDLGRVWHVKKPLDAVAMHAAAQTLIGHHDFTTFRDLACQAKSPMKTLDVANVRREDDEVILEFASRSFLHRQVRSMAGTLAEAGVGRWTMADVAAALEARDRKACGPVAPAGGLYLVGVAYKD